MILVTNTRRHRWIVASIVVWLALLSVCGNAATPAAATAVQPQSKSGDPPRRFVTVVNARNQLVERREFDGANALVATVRYDYDANGNMVRQRNGAQITEYRYDSLDRLIELIPPTGGPTEYRYGPGDQPIARIRAGEEIRYHYDRERLVLETNVLGNPIRHYAYSPSGLLVSTVFNPTPQHRSVHLDAQGSPIVLTAANGNIVSRVRFDAFGVEYLLVGGRDQAISFQGYWTNIELQAAGTLLSAARTYLPELGIFGERDPIEGTSRNPQSFNPYLFAYGNPYRWPDLDGRAPGSREIADLLADQRAGAITGIDAAKMGLAEGPWYAMPGMALFGAMDFAYAVATSVTGGAAEAGDLAADAAIAGIDSYVDLGEVGTRASTRILGNIETAEQVAGAIAEDPVGALGRGLNAAVDPYVQAIIQNDSSAQVNLFPDLRRAVGETANAMVAPNIPGAKPDPYQHQIFTESNSGPEAALVNPDEMYGPGSPLHKAQR